MIFCVMSIQYYLCNDFKNIYKIPLALFHGVGEVDDGIGEVDDGVGEVDDGSLITPALSFFFVNKM